MSIVYLLHVAKHIVVAILRGNRILSSLHHLTLPLLHLLTTPPSTYHLTSYTYSLYPLYPLNPSLSLPYLIENFCFSDKFQTSHEHLRGEGKRRKERGWGRGREGEGRGRKGK